MAKKPFKKYNANKFVEGVRLTPDNLFEVAIAVGGAIQGNGGYVETEQDLAMFGFVCLEVPTLDGVIGAAYDDYVFYDNGRLKVLEEAEFEAAYVVGQDRLWREAKAAEIAEGTDNG